MRFTITYPPLTGDFSADRAAFVAAGRPGDHPYLSAPADFWGAPAPIEPLVILVGAR